MTEPAREFISDAAGRGPSVAVMKVIEVRFLRGAGAYPDPVREVTAYFRAETGEPIVELDPCSPDGPGFYATVSDAGGGSVTVVVDRDLGSYPERGSRVWVESR